MTEFDAKDIERLIGEHSGFLGKPKAWTREYTSIQRMAWRMLQREKHSFFTFRRYVDGVSHLVKYLKVENPDQALEEIKKAKGIRARTAIFDSFINQLGKEGFKPINIKAIFWACNKFAVSNQIEVNWDFIAKPKAVTKIRDRIPTRAEISTILSFGNIRDKALFLTMMSSGLRVGTAISLKLKEYEHY
jgi:site-specific recombinase XerC